MSTSRSRGCRVRPRCSRLHACRSGPLCAAARRHVAFLGVGAAIPDCRRSGRISASDPVGFPEAALAIVFQPDRGACAAVAADRARRVGQRAAPRSCLRREDARHRPAPAPAELRTGAGKVFLDRYGELIELTASGQLAMRRLFEEHLKRIELGFVAVSRAALSVPVGVGSERGTPDRHRSAHSLRAAGSRQQRYRHFDDRRTSRRGRIRE